MVSSFKRKAFSSLALVAIALLVLAPVEASASCTWSISPSPNQNLIKYGNTLMSVSADSSIDGWAVGYYEDLATREVFTLAERWDGTDWQIISSPSPNASPRQAIIGITVPDSRTERRHSSRISSLGAHTSASSTNADFQGVSAVTQTNAWAVGEYYTGQYYSPLIEHWNGASWSVVKSPIVKFGHLFGVKAISANDVWAVGRVTPNADMTLIEHWNGVTWSVVPSPNASAAGSILISVTGTGPKDAWAVGFYTTAAGHDQTLAEHWNGIKWSIASTPNATTAHANYLLGVTALSAKDVFAVGKYYNATLQTYRTLAEHWNGSSWVIEATPNAFHYQTDFQAVAAVSPTEVLGVGEFYYQAGLTRPYAARWSGNTWAESFTPAYGNDSLYGASTIPGTSDVLAAGGTFYGSGDPNRTFIEQYHC